MWGITKAIVIIGIFIAVPSSALASGVSPSVDDLEVMQGEVAEHVVTVSNDEEVELRYSAELIGVDLGESEDDISFFELNQSDREWITLNVSEFVLRPGQERDLKVLVGPGENIASRSQVIGLRILEMPDSEADVRVTSGVISLLFLSVGDQLEESYSILDVKVSETYATEFPVQFYITIRNKGERFVQPSGSMEIENMLGKTVQILDLNPYGKRIPKEQTRTFLTSWSEEGAFTAGVYTATVRVTPWTGGDEFTEELTVVVIPWRTIALLSLFLGALFIIIKYASSIRSKL